MLYEFIFFFQAEDGIRDFHVTGVQTCALPIWVKGWYLQDFFDERKGDPDGSFRRRYEEVVADERIPRRTVKAIDIFKRIMLSQLETGNPFMFYRDEVNRKNPNKHAGMVYSSNLCTEI